MSYGDFLYKDLFVKSFDMLLLLLSHDLFTGLWLFSIPLSKNKLDR